MTSEVTHRLAWEKDDKGRGWLCVAYSCSMWSEPKMVTRYWPIARMGAKEAMDRFPIGKSVSDLGHGVYGRVELNGRRHNFRLLNGGSTEPIKSTEKDIPAPKCRVQTRYRNGRWEKLLKSKGWVIA